MKKFIYALVAILAVAAVVFFLQNNKSISEKLGLSSPFSGSSVGREADNENSNSSDLSSGKLGSGKLGENGSSSSQSTTPLTPSGSLIGRISGASIFTFTLFPRNIDRSLEGFFSFYSKLRGTALWKKADVEANFWKGFYGRWEEKQKTNPLAVSPDQMLSFYKEIAGYWQDLEEIAVSAAPQEKLTKLDGKEAALPQVMLGLRFSTPEQAKARLLSILEMAKGRGVNIDQLPGVSVTRTEHDEEFKFEVKNSQSAVDLAILRRGGDIFALFAASDAKSLFAQLPGESIEAKYAAARHAWANNPQPTGHLFLDVPEFIKVLEVVMSMSKQSTPEKAKEFNESLTQTLAFYRQFKSMAISFGKDSGRTTVSCLEAAPGTRLAGIYRQTFTSSDSAKDQADGALQFTKMLDENAIFGVGMRMRTLHQQLSVSAESMRSTFSSTAVTNESLKEFDSWFNQAEAIDTRFKFREVGFVVSPPILPPIVGAGVYFGGSSNLKGEALLAEFARTLNEIASGVAKLSTKYADPNRVVAPVEIASIVKRSDGSSYLNIKLGSLKVVGLLSSDDSVIVSIDHSIANELSRRLREGKSYLDELPEAGLFKDLLATDYVSYFNSKQLIDVARRFLPFFTARAGASLTAQEIDEVFDLLNFVQVSGQKSVRYEDIVCTESNAIFSNGK